jgi:hypothetical protein
MIFLLLMLRWWKIREAGGVAGNAPCSKLVHPPFFADFSHLSCFPPDLSGRGRRVAEEEG